MFRLISLEILHHHVLGNTRLEFCKDNGAGVNVNEIYTSVVIVVNGIGKSYLMRAIADIFSYLDALSRDAEIRKSPLGYKFYVKYKVGISVCEFTNIAEFEPAGWAARNYTYVSFKRDGEAARIGQMVS